MRIELLWFDGCPKYQAARTVLDNALSRRGIDESTVESIRVKASTADALRFAGSPTIRVDGRDVEPGFQDTGDYGLRCRLYLTSKGPGHAPDPDWIEAALNEALSGSN